MNSTAQDRLSRIEEIGRASGVTKSMDVAQSRHGILHRASEARSSETAYTASVPAGLHLSCGLATLQTSEAEFGTITLDHGGLIAMLCHEDRPHFQTQLAAGEARSCGLFVPLRDGFDSPQLEDIARRLSGTTPMQAGMGVPADRIARLCAPIDPWFQGSARDLVMEARALELIALFWNWLEQRDDQGTVRMLHKHQALKARDMIEGRLADPPSLDSLAREVGINVRSLTAAFRQSFGLSIAAYVTRRRLEQGERHMRAGMSVGRPDRRTTNGDCMMRDDDQGALILTPDDIARAQRRGASFPRFHTERALPVGRHIERRFALQQPHDASAARIVQRDRRPAVQMHDRSVRERHNPSLPRAGHGIRPPPDRQIGHRQDKRATQQCPGGNAHLLALPRPPDPPLRHPLARRHSHRRWRAIQPRP